MSFKKTTWLFVLSFIFFSIALPALAQDASIEASPLRRRDEIREVRQAEIQEIQAERQQIRSQVAENHANRLTRRFQFYFDRLTNIITRFRARLEILRTAGKTVTSIEAKLDLAEAKLTAAKAKGNDAIAAFQAIDPAKFAEQKTELLAAKDLALSAKQLFQEAHQLLKDALKELKTISKPALPASSAGVENSL